MSNKLNQFIEVLNNIREFCNSEGELVIDQYVKKLQFEKPENIEQEFFNFFEQQNPNFFSVLRTHHPDLTEKEEKMCALIVSEFNNKKIADFFANSESTIKTARKFLRRKLQISPNTNLYDYLKTI